jgi:hypothetical protein
MEQAAATILVPSADEATDPQPPGGALVCVQVWANAESAIVNNPPQAAITSSMDLMIFMMFLSHPTAEQSLFESISANDVPFPW